MNTLPDVDIAIVGGGISGIYTGWKLRTQNLGKSPPADWAGKRDGGLKVAVYEGTTRIGGRLLPQVGGDGVGGHGVGEHEAEQRDADEHQRQQHHTPGDVAAKVHRASLHPTRCNPARSSGVSTSYPSPGRRTSTTRSPR